MTTLGVGDGLHQLGGVQLPGYAQLGGQVERGDGQAADSLDLADLLDVVDGGPGLDQQRADRFPASLAQVVKQVRTQADAAFAQLVGQREQVLQRPHTSRGHGGMEPELTHRLGAEDPVADLGQRGRQHQRAHQVGPGTGDRLGGPAADVLTGNHRTLQPQLTHQRDEAAGLGGGEVLAGPAGCLAD